MKPKQLVPCIALVFGLIALWLVVLQFLPRPVEANWIKGIYRKKELAAQSIAGPKALIIGGSGSHFSYSAGLISEITGLPVVNLATHGGLGGEYLLRRARRSLKPGDTAILALEYQLIVWSKPSALLATYVATNDRRYLVSAPLRDLPALIFGYSPVQIVREAAATVIPWRSPLYRVEAVTSFGDESANTPENKQPYMADTVRAHPGLSAIRIDPTKPGSYLVEFAEWAKKNDIRLLQAWPVTTFRPKYLTPEFASYFDRFVVMYRRLGFEVLGKPESFFLPEDEMLDSLYHADSVGAARASRALATELCRVTDCPKGPALISKQ